MRKYLRLQRGFTGQKYKVFDDNRSCQRRKERNAGTEGGGWCDAWWVVERGEKTRAGVGAGTKVNPDNERKGCIDSNKQMI